MNNVIDHARRQVAGASIKQLRAAVLAVLDAAGLELDAQARHPDSMRCTHRGNAASAIVDAIHDQLEGAPS